MDHTVQQGEYLQSISEQYGFRDYRTIYEHSDNADFKNNRPNPQIIYPGDTIVIPDKEQKQESRPTGQVHTFVVKSQRIKLKVYVRRRGEPVANQPYTLTVGDLQYQDQTDGDGLVEKDVPIGAPEALLHFDGPPVLDRRLLLGHLDPITTTSGVRGRLNNLGLWAGEPDAPDDDPDYASALRAFQTKHGLDVSGEADDATIAQLQQEYDAGTPS